jgi:hypothetical protein
MANQAPVPTRATDRELYLPAAAAVLAAVIVGFWRSYFSRPFFPQTDSLTVLVHVHAALMTAWMCLFLAQVGLVAVGRTDLHRRLGVGGFALLVMIVVVSVPMTILATRLGGSHMPGPPLPALASVSGLLIGFITLGGLGLHYRYRTDIHKRLMLLAAISGMEAGVGRIPVDFLDSLTKIHIANDVVLLFFVVADTLKHRRLHPALLWGSFYLIAVQTITAWVAGTATWLAIARAIMRPFS